MKIYKIPSKTESNKFYLVKESRGKYICECPSYKVCWHIRKVKWWRKEIKGNPEHCFYTHNRLNLQEHHLLRAADREKSLTIWLEYRIHERATRDKWFEKHLLKLFLNKRPMENFKMKATLTDINQKRCASSDKTYWFYFETEDRKSYKEFAIEDGELIKVQYEQLCVMGQFRGGNMPYHGSKVLIKFKIEVAPGEDMNVLAFQNLPKGTLQVDIIYDKN